MTHDPYFLRGLDLERLEYLADLLSITVKKGDFVALSGDLGAGKTTFARFFINNMVQDVVEIPSPTFAIVQDYEGARLPIWHFDFYRIGEGNEALELGLDDALEQGMVLGEWSERLEEFLPAERLDIAFSEEEADPDLRTVVLTAFGQEWQSRLDRMAKIDAFLQAEGWSTAKLTYLQGDASARSYARLYGEKGAAILMNAPRLPDGPPIRDDGKTYSDLAHLAEDIKPFIAVGNSLKAGGFATPDIFSYDLDDGFILLEDLGNDVYGSLINAGSDRELLYQKAVEVLALLAQKPAPKVLPVSGVSDYILPSCSADVLAIEIELLPDWFYPVISGHKMKQADLDGFYRVWKPLLEQVSQDQSHWMLRDFHSPNLLDLSGKTVREQVGIIDFQDALAGNSAYDLVSLLQDARLDISAALEQQLFDHYRGLRLKADSSFDQSKFARDYAILGAQRNTKILGIFARLAKRDNKPAYLVHIPRISAYLERNLHHPGLEALMAWYDTHLPVSKRVITS